MIARILLAVDDSPASLAAARLAAALGAALNAQLRVTHVAVDHELGEALRKASARPEVATRVVQGRHALLNRVRALVAAAGVEVEVKLLTGEVAAALLTDASLWEADLLVIGRSARGTGDPHVGSQARHVLEFSELPVVVRAASGGTDALTQSATVEWLPSLVGRARRPAPMAVNEAPLECPH